MRKRFSFIFIILSVLLMFSSCSTNAENENLQETVSTSENITTETPEQTTEATTVNNEVTEIITKKPTTTEKKVTTTTKVSNSKPSGNSNSSGGNSTTTKPTKPAEKPSEEKHCTNKNNHSIACGNMGMWFDSRQKVDEYFTNTRKEWLNKYQEGDITWEEYIYKAPVGYECWSCSYCGLWTGNFKYRDIEEPSKSE